MRVYFFSNRYKLLSSNWMDHVLFLIRVGSATIIEAGTQINALTARTKKHPARTSDDLRAPQMRPQGDMDSESGCANGFWQS